MFYRCPQFLLLCSTFQASMFLLSCASLMTGHWSLQLLFQNWLIFSVILLLVVSCCLEFYFQVNIIFLYSWWFDTFISFKCIHFTVIKSYLKSILSDISIDFQTLLTAAVAQYSVFLILTFNKCVSLGIKHVSCETYNVAFTNLPISPFDYIIDFPFHLM